MQRIGLDKEGKPVAFDVANVPARIRLRKPELTADVTITPSDQIFGTSYHIGPGALSSIPINVKGRATATGLVSDGSDLIYEEQR